MNKERSITSEALRKGGILTAALGVLFTSAPAVGLGVLAYFTGDQIRPKPQYA
jgi:hypothetical protein